ncbi:hypothetical protein [Photobacterium damselae]|uniref:hypothetical protein n=1 Tax=Photobacterium damselae TaxID=38293 RepID=UPI0040678232
MNDKYFVSGVLGEFSYYALHLGNKLILEDKLIVNNVTLVNDVFEGIVETPPNDKRILNLYTSRLETVKATGKSNA